MIPVSGQPNGQMAPLAAQSGSAGGIGGPSASPPGGTPKRMMRQRAPQTFAGMQQAGVARPSPQMVEAQANANRLTAMNQQMQAQSVQAQGQAPQGAPAASPYQPTAAGSLAAAQQTVDNASAGRSLGAYRTSANVDALGAPLMGQVMSLLQDPTQGLNEAAQSNFDRNNRVLSREFGTLREDLNESMAARGLDASTIAATKLGDLGARQAEAQADLAARVQEKLITDRSAAMNNAINAAMGLRGQEADLGQAEYTINRDTGELEWRRNFDAAAADRDASQFAQRLGLDAELGRGNLAINQGQLALADKRFGYDMSRDARDFAYQQGRDQANDAFRGAEFDWRRSTDARDFDWRNTTDQRDFDYRTGRDAIADQRYTDQWNRDATWRDEDQAYREGRDAVGDQRFTDQWNRDADWRNQDTSYRDRRDQVGDARYDQQWSAQQGQQQIGNLLSLLQGMGFNNLPAGALNSIFTSLGIPLPAAGGTGGGVGGRTPQDWRSSDPTDDTTYRLRAY